MNNTIITLLNSKDHGDIKLGLELAGHTSSYSLNAALRVARQSTRFEFMSDHIHRNGKCFGRIRPPKRRRK